MVDLKDVDNMKTRTVYFNICNAGVVNSNLTADINDMGFEPNYVEISEVNVSRDTPNSSMYILYSDIANQNICSFSGATATNNTASIIVPIRKKIPQMTFSFRMVGLDGQLTSPVMAGNWYLAMTLTFIRLKNYTIGPARSLQ